MQYILLIYNTEPANPPARKDRQNTMDPAYGAFTKMLREHKVMVSGEALHPVATATTVRVRDNKAKTTDGPFAETKEQLGGFYIIDAKDLDEAIDYAAQIPGAKTGSVEIRPLVDFSQS